MPRCGRRRFAGPWALAADSADQPTRMAYLKAIKTPAVRLANGREAGEFFRDAGRLKQELEPLKAK